MKRRTGQFATFWIRLTGEAVRPRVVPVRAVASILRAVQTIALGPEAVSPENPKVVENRLSLVSVKNGSALYGCFTEESAKAEGRMKLARSILRDPDWKPTSHPTDEITQGQFAELLYNPLRDLSRVAHSTGTRIEIFRNPSGRSLLTFDQFTFRDFRSRISYTGSSTVYARIERVGGVVDKKCMVRPFDQPKLVFCKIASDATARELGKRIYADAILTGQVTRLNFTGEIQAMTIERVQPFKRLTADRLIDEMREVGGMVFDEVDMAEFQRELYD